MDLSLRRSWGQLALTIPQQTSTAEWSTEHQPSEADFWSCIAGLRDPFDPSVTGAGVESYPEEVFDTEPQIDGTGCRLGQSVLELSDRRHRGDEEASDALPDKCLTIAFSTLHGGVDEDPAKSKAQRMASVCDPEKPTVITHPGGHIVLRDPQTISKMLAAIHEMSIEV